jgi:hypothetical protein
LYQSALQSRPDRKQALLRAEESKIASVTTDSSVKIPVKKISSGRIIHRFFDTSPVSPSGRYLALFRFPSETSSPKPGDAGEVIVVDMKTGKEKVVARSRGWEMQLGANVQWGSSDKELYFNDVDTSSWKAFAVQLDPISGKKKGNIWLRTTWYHPGMHR